jgi:hypothetical protein
MTRTRSPRSTKPRVSFEPITPAPPVTRIMASLSLPTIR